MADKVINPFTDIDSPLVGEFQKTNRNEIMDSLSVGGGSRSFKADESGIWLWSEKWENAPFRVDMDGNSWLNSVTLGGTSIIKSSKETFMDTLHAGYYISPEGIYFWSAGDATKIKYSVATGSLDLVGKISGLQTSTIASAINSSGNFIKEVVNSNLDTSARNILSTFQFGPSGAISMLQDANNGLWISQNGMLGKKAGATTFAIDTYWNATFAGTLVATNGTLGNITAGNITGATITGGTIRTAISGKRVELNSNNKVQVFNDSGVEVSNYGYDAGSSFNNILWASVPNDGKIGPLIRVDTARNTNAIYAEGSSSAYPVIYAKNTGWWHALFADWSMMVGWWSGARLYIWFTNCFLEVDSSWKLFWFNGSTHNALY